MNVASSWARELKRSSSELSTAAYLPNVLSNLNALHESIDRMFRRFRLDQPPNARAWVDGGQRYTINDGLIDLAQETHMALPTRLAKAAGSEKYCVTLNGLSAWDPWFALETQRLMLDPLFEELGGGPAAGVDFYTFLGNYGFTPFGVHDDLDHSLLWHLGPHSKIAYVWPRAAYVELTGGELSTLDYESLISHARRYELRPGDLLFIPKGDFHVLQTASFSCTLGLTIFPDDLLTECSEGLRLMGITSADAPMMDAPLTLLDLAMFRRLAVESNGFVITPPNRCDSREFDCEAMRRISLSSSSFWPLRTVQVGDRQALLVRGRVIWARTNPVFNVLCELLAGGRCLPFEAVRNHLKEQINEGPLIELITVIARMGGVALQTNDS